MLKSLKALFSDESGATAIEYGLLIALIAVMLIAGATLIGQQVDAIFNSVGETLQNAAGNAEESGE